MLKAVVGGASTANITSVSGTGVTVNVTGASNRKLYKITFTNLALSAAVQTADLTIATLPAKTKVCSIISDTTTPYTGGTVVAATLIIGKTVGGNEYIISHDVFTAATRKGLADADLGASLTRATAVQGGDIPSFTTTTNISVRLATGAVNTNQCTAGTTTVYLETETAP